MATFIAAECSECRQISEQPSRVFTLYRCEQTGGRDFYTFTCPVCMAVVTKTATVEIVALLMGARVRVVKYRAPLELADPRRYSGEPIGWDDVLDFIGNLNKWEGEISERSASGVDRTGEGVAASGA